MFIEKLPAIFDDHGIEIVIIGGERWVMANQIGSALGFAMPAISIRNIFNRHKREFGPDDTLVIEVPDRLGRPQLSRLYSKTGIAKIAMFANTARAAAFRDWAARELTTPQRAALPAPAREYPAITGTALSVLRQMFLERPKSKRMLHLLKIGNSIADTARILDVTAETVRKRRRAAEALGLIDVPANLAHQRLHPAFQKMLTSRQPVLVTA